MSEIEEMTLPQIQLYSVAVIRHVTRENISIMGLTRAAYHANEQEYTRLIKDMEI